MNPKINFYKIPGEGRTFEIVHFTPIKEYDQVITRMNGHKVSNYMYYQMIVLSLFCYPLIVLSTLHAVTKTWLVKRFIKQETYVYLNE